MLLANVDATTPDDEAELPSRPLRTAHDRLAQRLQDWELDARAGLFVAQLDGPVPLDVLDAKPGGVADAQAGVAEHREQEAFGRSVRPIGFEPGEILLSPRLVPLLLVGPYLRFLDPVHPISRVSVD